MSDKKLRKNKSFLQDECKPYKRHSLTGISHRSDIFDENKLKPEVKLRKDTFNHSRKKIMENDEHSQTEDLISAPHYIDQETDSDVEIERLNKNKSCKRHSITVISYSNGIFVGENKLKHDVKLRKDTFNHSRKKIMQNDEHSLTEDLISAPHYIDQKTDSDVKIERLNKLGKENAWILAKLEEISIKQNEIERNNGYITSKLNEIEQQGREMSSKINEIEFSQRETSSKLRELERNKKQMDSRLQEIIRNEGDTNSRLNEIERSHRTIISRIDKFELKMSINLSQEKRLERKLCLRIEEIERNAVETDDKLEEIERNNKLENYRFEKIERNNIETSSRLKELERNQRQTSSYLEKIDTNEREIVLDLQEINMNKKEISLKFDSIEKNERENRELPKYDRDITAKVNEITENGRRTSAQVAEIEKYQDELKTKVNEIQRSEAQTSDKINDIKKNQTELNTIVLKIEESWTQTRDKVDEIKRNQLQSQVKVNEIEKSERETSEKIRNIENYFNINEETFEWKIGKVEKIAQNDFITSESFRPIKCPNKCGLKLWNEINLLSLQLIIYGAENDDRIKWPFRAKVIMTIQNEFDGKNNKSICKNCVIRRPPNGQFDSSDWFKFAKSDLVIEGILMSHTESKDATYCVIKCFIEEV